MSQFHDQMRNMTMADFYKADLVDGDMWNDDDEDGDDIYIMVKCLFVTKNHHFLLWVSCNHLNHP